MTVSSPESDAIVDKLPTREQWNEIVSFQTSIAEATGNPNLGVVFVDINGFKSVNDRIGYEEGNTVISAVGELVANASSWFRNNDIISHESLGDAQAAKWGGDEFAILAHTDENGIRELVDRVRSEFTDYISQPEQKELRDLGVGLAIGASMYELGKTPGELISEASEAMKQDKKNQLPELTPHEKEVISKIHSLLDQSENSDILLRHLVQR